MQAPHTAPAAAGELDLDRYFARLGYRGRPQADLETLRSLTALQPAAIPFEAIDVLLGRHVDLSPGAIQAKLIDGGRGGYCFEQNGLLRQVLAALWYTSTHPASAFRRELRVASTTLERRTTLLNDRLTVRHADGRVDRRFLSEHEITAALASTFALRIDPESARQAAAIAAGQTTA
jgi:arylamine N-acetyltransferase